MPRNDPAGDVVSFIRTKGWGTALSVIFSSIAVTTVCIYFLYSNFSQPKDIQAVVATVTDLKVLTEKAATQTKSDFDIKIVEIKEEQKDLKADNVRLRTEVRDELRELRGLVIELVQRTPKKYSRRNFEQFDGDGVPLLFKHTKAVGL